jgi:hypothetical protein
MQHGWSVRWQSQVVYKLASARNQPLILDPP